MTDAGKISINNNKKALASWYFHIRDNPQTQREPSKWFTSKEPLAEVIEPEASKNEEDTVTQLLSMGENAHILIITGNTVQFYHQLFQNYFAALYSHNNLTEKLNIGENTRTHLSNFSSMWELWAGLDAELVEKLIVQLEEKSDPNLRARSADALAKIMDSRAVEPLITALSDSDNTLQTIACIALGVLGDSRAVEPPIPVLGNPDETVRAIASIGLRILGKIAVEPLIMALSNPDGAVRTRVSFTLGELGEVAVKPLIAAFSNPNNLVRKSAAEALDEIKRNAKRKNQKEIKPTLTF
jgi:hypothetical protein